MYQLEVKAALVAQQFPPTKGWLVTVDVDAMERAIGGTHPADKRSRVDLAYGSLQRLEVTLGKKHPVYIRADIVATHPEHGTVVVEVEGSSARQKEQAMYAAIGQLLVSMRHDKSSISYAIAVPDDPEWRRQIEKLPVLILKMLKMRVLFVTATSVSEFPDEIDVSERILLDDESASVLPDGAEDELTEYLAQYSQSDSKPPKSE